MGSSHTPEELLYQFPRTPPVRLVKYARKYYTARAMELLQQVAQGLGMEVIDGANLHWRQKKLAAAKCRWGVKWYYLFRQKEDDRLGD